MRQSKLIGKQFNNWTVLEKTGLDTFLCRCSCGNEVVRYASTLYSGASTGCSKCCRERYCGAATAAWRGKGEIPRHIFSRCRRHAQSRGLAFEVSIDHVADLYEKQGRKCAITGLHLLIGRRNGPPGSTTASLDRIGSSEGYIEGNVWWVHWRINNMKGNMQQGEFAAWCRLVACGLESIDEDDRRVILVGGTPCVHRLHQRRGEKTAPGDGRSDQPPGAQAA